MELPQEKISDKSEVIRKKIILIFSFGFFVQKMNEKRKGESLGNEISDPGYTKRPPRSLRSLGVTVLKNFLWTEVLFT